MGRGPWGPTAVGLLPMGLSALLVAELLKHEKKM